MLKPEIQRLLVESYAAFTAQLRSLPESQVHQAAPGKWSPAQQAEHLVKSVRPVTLALSLPKLILPFFFGKANRPSRTYDDLIVKYKAKLAAGGKSSKPFVPGVPTNPSAVYNDLEKTVASLCNRMETFSEEQLDRLILPHPLLGKLTLREMLYFTAYHAKHHQQLIDSTHSVASKP